MKKVGLCQSVVALVNPRLTILPVLRNDELHSDDGGSRVGNWNQLEPNIRTQAEVEKFPVDYPKWRVEGQT